MTEAKPMTKNWSRLIKVSFITAVSLVAILAIAYSWVLRSTGMGALFDRQPEIERKAVEYGMLRSKKDLTGAGNMEIDPVSEKIFVKASKIDERNFRLNQPLLAYYFGPSGQVLPNDNLDSDIKAYLPRNQAFLAQCLPLLSLSPSRKRQVPFSLDHYFVNDIVNPEYALGLDTLSKVEGVILGQAILAAKEGDVGTTIANIRLETKIRKLACLSNRFLGTIHQVKARSVAAPPLLVTLQYFPNPSRKLLAAIRESQANDKSFHFENSCRMLFYYGSDGFPDGEEYRLKTRDLEQQYRRYLILPQIRHAWKLFIQEAAIKAFEANAKAGGGLDGVEAGMQAMNVSVFNSDELFFEARLPLPSDFYMLNSYSSFYRERLATKLKSWPE